MNDENLVPMNNRTVSEQREIAKKGGKASGRARRDKRQQKEVILELLSLPMETGGVEKIQALAEAEGKNISVNQAIVIQQIKKALEGDTKAAEYIRDTAGQKPSENVHVETGNIDEAILNVQAYLKGKKNEDE